MPASSASGLRASWRGRSPAPRGGAGAWGAALASENFDPFRSGMTGCFRCPVNCRPLNDVRSLYPSDPDLTSLVKHVDSLGFDGSRYLHGEGPEYVTVGTIGRATG